MIPFLIATSLTCSEAHELVDKMRAYDVEEQTRIEMISIVKEETEGCWQQMGGEIWMDPSINLDHYGSYQFQGNIAEQFTLVKKS